MKAEAKRFSKITMLPQWMLKTVKWHKKRATKDAILSLILIFVVLFLNKVL
ncbi:hypothetical protein BGM26_09070 [Bacillus sp. FJAT-29790]|uniref:hypothetical protein n=1 Tax=Bacillus sp. FJAT-29790 TaxID=1895002 RepID=UPI001C248726|nr:hypothetical protein [Bacillus sp. FJAT-29790]MBU8879135.1 hypothetical protein [Bacillus sp. FJAT-29790]